MNLQNNTRIHFLGSTTANRQALRSFLLLCFICSFSCLFAQKSDSNNQVTVSTFAAETVTNWNADLNNKSVVLHWTAAADTNLSHFVVQRSYNGTDYADIAIFFAAVKGDNRTGYKYTDKLNPLAEGPVYYRLKIQDLAGRKRLSDYVTVVAGKPAGEILGSVSSK